jgi:nitrite reductase/ring-hydroxylating ferredoxin subunit
MFELCRMEDLAATGAKSVVVDDAGRAVGVFVVRYDGHVFAYFNACPHARLPLNAHPDAFFDVGRAILVCVNHGAQFDVATGRCLRGPCKGEALKPFPIRRDGDRVMATDSDYSAMDA